MVHNLFEQPNEFDDDIDTLVDEAYAENLAAGRVMTDEFADTVGKNAMEDAIQAHIENQHGTFTPPHDRLNMHEIEDSETLLAFVRAFANIKSTFAPVGLEPPTPTEFHELASIDFGRLADLYENMQRQELGPLVVIAPHMQSISFWQTAMHSAREHSAANHPDMVRGRALHVWDDVLHLWDSLRGLPAETPNFKNWTIRIIPGFDSPPPESEYNRHDYPTVSEYLSIQATRFHFDRVLMNSGDSGDGPMTILSGGRAQEFTPLLVYGRAGNVSRQVEISITDSSWLENTRVRHHKPAW